MKTYITENVTSPLFTASSSFINVLAEKDQRNNLEYFDYITDAGTSVTSMTVYV